MTASRPEPMPPVLYLDVDGMLLRHPHDFITREEQQQWWADNRHGGPANGVREFLEWATTACEARWLTAWGCGGDIGDEGRARLAEALRVPVELLARVNVNPLGWSGNKAEGINFDEGRDWFWLDDAAIPRETLALAEHDAVARRILTRTSSDPDALLKSWAFIRELLSRRRVGAIDAARTPTSET